ncbi:MAG: potassium channel family protein, partial [Clostridia bacterium]
MKSILIIGMGKLGYHLAINMQELGNDVMVADYDEKLIEGLSGKFTDAIIGDCTNEDVLESIGVKQFDMCFVTIGENFQSSLEITSLLKEHGAKYVISKANSKIQSKFLLRNGADEVIYPEYQTAQRLARRCSMNNVFDCIELTDEYSIYEIPAPSEWAGKTIASINVRSKYGINILALKGGGKLNPMPGPEYVFKRGDHMIVMG